MAETSFLLCDARTTLANFPIFFEKKKKKKSSSAIKVSMNLILLIGKERILKESGG